MPERTQTDSQQLLRRLRDTMAEEQKGQARLNKITHLIADSMGTEVCSIYLFRDNETLELCATEGLNTEAVHQTRLRIGEGLVGRVARSKKVINTEDAPSSKGFRFMPETGEEIFSSFAGVPIQRLGETLGVLVTQSKESRKFSSEEIYALEVVAMVLAEMAELGAFVGDETGLTALHQQSVLFRGSNGQEGAAKGSVWLHEPRVVVTNLVSDDPKEEKNRLQNAVNLLRQGVDKIVDKIADGDKEQTEILKAFRMFANSRGWLRRMEADIDQGLSAEASVEKEQSSARARMSQVADSYMRERLHDLDDLSNRLLRILTGQGTDTGAEIPKDPILIARNIGPAELLDYGRTLKAIVLEEGSVGSHAAIVARALSIPLVINAENITTEALNGDPILVDGTQGIVHLRPDDTVVSAFSEKIAMEAKNQERYKALRNEPAKTTDGKTIDLRMNAGLMAELPSLISSGANGVGLFRTELQFLIRNQMPKRSELKKLYSRVLEAAKGKEVIFRTLDIGSDKVLSYMPNINEANPALGWRAIRIALDRPSIMRMQIEALIRAADGRNLSIMFPLISQDNEFYEARALVDKVLSGEERLGHKTPNEIKIGAMLETPSLAYASENFFSAVDFLSVGGNDLKQFFFAADRENEMVRRKYDTLSTSFLIYLKFVIDRCAKTQTPVSFCGEDAGRPLEAICLCAIGFPSLSMRPTSIGPVKHLLRRINLEKLNDILSLEIERGSSSVRPAVEKYIKSI